MSSVKVAVRVRPFNQRERDMGSKCILEMKDTMTKITDPETGKDRKYYFDYSYWSHDGYKEVDGVLMKDKPSSIYTDQRQVFQDLGVDVLNNAFEGYHTCLFAYGQTGSGKSYSIVGYGNNKGIIPMACEEIFERVNAAKQDSKNKTQYDLRVSMLEIYNENVQDLFMNPIQRPKGGLKVREHPKTGVFVEDLSKIQVHSYAEIQKCIDNGTNNRTIGATQMNATSSRAHTVVTITFIQKFFDETGKPLNQKESHINLVDLAGSERAGSTGATGDRLKEGSNINKSLSTLGKVISTLAEKSQNKKKDIVVPYRDSKLTRILQNALGGNSKTCMIAALSPASVNYDETLSTLRYADQVKSIKNVATINESPQEKLIRELKEENERLKALVGGAGGAAAGFNPAQLEELKKKYEEELEMNRLAMQDLEKNWEEKLKAGGAPKEVEPEIQGIHLMNLNEDPFLTGKIKFQLKDGQSVLGKNDRENPPDMIIGGIGTVKQHCAIEFQSGNTTAVLLPNSDPAKNKVHINGKLITEPTELCHNDRILFGNHNYFLFVDPQNDEAIWDWEFAMKEVHQDQIKAVVEGDDEETTKKLQELQERLEKEKEEAERKYQEQMKQMEEQKAAMERELQEKAEQIKAELQGQQGSSEYQKKLKEMQEQLEAQKKEQEKLLKEQAEKLKKQVQQEEERVSKQKLQEEQKIRMQKNLEERLAQAIPKVMEVNEICLQMGRLNYLYKPYLMTEIKEGQKISKLCVKVYPDHNQDFFNVLEFDDFTEKYYLIKEKFENYTYDLDNAENVEDVEDNTEDDPVIFGIGLRNEHVLIGQAHIYLDSLANLLETMNDQTPIIDHKGERNGEIKYSLIPKYYENDNEQNLLMFDNVEDLEGKTLNVTVDIISVRGIPSKYNSDVYVKYIWIDENSEEFQTEISDKKTSNPEFNYKQEHELVLTKYTINHLWESSLVFMIYGKMPQESLEKIAHKIGGIIENNAQGGGAAIKKEANQYHTNEANHKNNQSFEQTNNTTARAPAKGEAAEMSKKRLEQELQSERKKNEELQKQLMEKDNLIAKHSSCCIIF